MTTANKSDQWIRASSGAQLFLRRWMPEGEVRAVTHIIHGMAEHGGRYEQTACRLADEGIEVWIADMRGHGKTADTSVNSEGTGGKLGHCADNNTIAIICSDIDLINAKIMQDHPNTPLFLMGHSWGSFLVQNYIETYNTTPLAGCILSGTRGPDGTTIAVSKYIMACIAALGGCRRKSRLADALVFGPYNKPFKPNRTSCDWVSRDEKIVDAYIEDERSGMLCSAGFFRDLTALLNTIHQKSALSRIRKDLPVYVFCGNADPVGDMGKSPTALVNAYRAEGVADLEFALYPDARHETLNEINRDEVIANLISWLNKKISLWREKQEKQIKD